MACSLVLMDDLFVRDTVDDRYGFLQNQRCCSFVAAGIDCLAGSFDRCTQGRTLTGIVQVLLNCLTSTLTCLCGICHLYFLKRGRECLRGKPDRGAEFCKATDYNQFFAKQANTSCIESNSVARKHTWRNDHPASSQQREHSGAQLITAGTPPQHTASQNDDQNNNASDSRESCGSRWAPAIMPLHELA